MISLVPGRFSSTVFTGTAYPQRAELVKLFQPDNLSASTAPFNVRKSHGYGDYDEHPEASAIAIPNKEDARHQCA
jgi:hypothetical protein